MSEIQDLRIGTIDNGKAQARLDEYIGKIAADVVGRSGVKKPRTVTLQVEIIPDVDPETGVNMPKIGWKVSHAVPGAKGSITSSFVEDGKLKVNVNAPYDAKTPDQPTLFADTGEHIIDIARADGE